MQRKQSRFCQQSVEYSHRVREFLSKYKVECCSNPTWHYQHECAGYHTHEDRRRNPYNGPNLLYYPIQTPHGFCPCQQDVPSMRASPVRMRTTTTNIGSIHLSTRPLLAPPHARPHIIVGESMQTSFHTCRNINFLGLIYRPSKPLSASSLTQTTTSTLLAVFIMEKAIAGVIQQLSCTHTSSVLHEEIVEIRIVSSRTTRSSSCIILNAIKASIVVGSSKKSPVSILSFALSLILMSNSLSNFFTK